ncbi:MAG: linear amide C-N hydrolase [Bacteroidales bacterium]|nr:linear amide C-N hydrolase [Bacteroidales bacterium]
MKRLLVLALAIAGFFAIQKADACSRVVYEGDTTETEVPNTPQTPNALHIVGRSLDWKTPIPTNLFVYPRGMKKKSNDKGKCIEWTSKYGSVYAVSYNSGITEGLNEKGLSINGLFCKGTVYNSERQADKPYMSLAVFVAWMLDQCATTQEVIDLVKAQDFHITGATFDGGTVSTLHWGVTDPSGDTALLEFHDGQLNIYQGFDMPVLTNDPTWPQMNAINDYWQKVGGANMLPGTVKSPDRFVRGYFFDHNVQHVSDRNVALAIVRSILANVSVPYLYTVDSDPNVSSTQWRSFSNLRDRLYYFDVVTNLGLVYVDLSKCDLNPGASVLYWDTTAHPEAVGDITAQMEKVQPFTPMYSN